MKTVKQIHEEALKIKKASSPEGSCQVITAGVEAYLDKVSASKVNHLKHSGEEGDCPCGHGKGDESKVDLIILIDSSGSMYRSAEKISDAAKDAIKAAQKSCKVDLRTKWLWVDMRNSGPDAATVNPFPSITHNFETSHEVYLRSIGFTGPFPQETPPTVGEGYNPEEGADAIKVLSEKYDWREDACRAIFYISDTNLDSYGYDADDQTATDKAIASATANEVSIFAHYVEPHQGGSPETVTTYTDLTTKTGGKAQIGKSPTKELYVTLLQEAICEACNSCKKFNFPDVEPCIEISWGDSECDGFETDDVEVLCIKVCNCYSNIVFHDFTIGYILVEDAEGKTVALLPDGTPSVAAIPVGPFCFGDIGPCKDGEPTCKTRQFVVRTRGAIAGDYSIRLGGICYSVSRSFFTEKRFQMKLCKD